MAYNENAWVVLGEKTKSEKSSHNLLGLNGSSNVSNKEKVQELVEYQKEIINNLKDQGAKEVEISNTVNGVFSCIKVKM